MRQSSKIIALAALLLLVFTLGATTLDTDETESASPGMELFLWEPGWSPTSVPSGLRGIWTEHDGANGLTAYDIDHDGMDELLLGRDGIHVLHIQDSAESLAWGSLPIGDAPETGKDSLRIHWLGVQDINVDGQEEIVLISYPNELRVLRYDMHRRRYYDVVSDTVQEISGPLANLVFMDHNGDGYMDLVGCDYEPGVGGAYVLFGDAAGSLGRPTSFTGPSGSMRGTQQGSYGGMRGTWLLGSDALWFSEESTTNAQMVHAAGGTGLALIDVDGDGIDEIVILNSDEVSVWAVIDRKLSLSETIRLPYESPFLGTGDFDGDGHPDLCVMNWYASEYLLLFNREGALGDVLMRQKTAGQLSLAVRPAIGDFDGDGRDDIAYTSGSGSSRVGLAMTGAIGYAMQPQVGSTVLGKSNNNLLCRQGSRVLYLENSGSGIFSARNLVDAPKLPGEEEAFVPLEAQYADVTSADGEELIVLGKTETRLYVVVWEQLEDEWQQAFVCPLEGGTYAKVAIADIDDQPENEIVVASRDGFTICSDRRNADDFDGIGRTETLILAGGGLIPYEEYSSSEVVALSVDVERRETALLQLKDGDIAVVQHLSQLIVPAGMVICDLDSNGSSDIALVGIEIIQGESNSAYELRILHLLARGDGTFEEKVIDTPALLAAGIPAALTSGDYDGNGTPDIGLVVLAESLATTQQLVVLLFDGDEYNSAHIGSGSLHPSPVSVDIDGDGRLELVQGEDLYRLSIIRAVR